VESFARDVDRLWEVGTTSGQSEAVLLDRFARRGDELAFEAIVARHGPMVWAVCRRSARDPNDADDAFQATFLILARSARSIRNRERLGPWLHGVAYRVAIRARARQEVTKCGLKGLRLVGPDSPSLEAEARERAHLLHEEIERLPGKYRDPIILCHLQGCSHEEAAERLGWPVGTVRGRLARGRDQLRDRLQRRGIASIALVGDVTTPLALPETLVGPTVSAAIGFAAGCLKAGFASARAVGWAERGLIAMRLGTLKAPGLATLAVFVIGVGGFALARQEGTEKAASAPGVASSKAQDSTRERRVENELREVNEHQERREENELREVNEQQERREDIAKLARLEAKVDLLALEVESIRQRLTSSLQKLDQMEDTPQNLGGLDEQTRRHREELRDLNIRRLQEKTELLRKTYLERKMELGRLQGEIKVVDRKIERQTVDQPLPASLERRLSAIEDVLKKLVNAVEKQSRSPR
jgi:RNA polymerase sigma factor (sigma-70 family)